MSLASQPSTDLPAEFANTLRARIQSISYLPTTVDVAMKLISLGHDADASPADYAQLISADPGLSAKILALANSSWFGVRNRVTRPQVAVSLMGLGTVRTLAISYCLTGLHHELRLTPEESKRFWSTSIYKAIAARQIIGPQDIKLAEEAFAAAIFQDIAHPVMYSVCRRQMDDILQNQQMSCQQRLKAENTLFGMDHTMIGQQLAICLELPIYFQDMIRYHHGRTELNDVIDAQPMSMALHIASLLPHQMGVWNPMEIGALQKTLEHLPNRQRIEVNDFLNSIENEFRLICKQFQCESEHMSVSDLYEQATREMADSTSRLVGTVQELMHQAAATGEELHLLLHETNHLEKAAISDALTGTLNRLGFENYGREIIEQCATDPRGFAILYMDLDGFKQLNDTYGHAAGDAALKRFAETAGRTLRQGDLLARVGGDEFVIMLQGVTDQEAYSVGERLLSNIRQSNQGHKLILGLSVGLLWIKPNGRIYPLESIVQAADKLMYQAKRAGRGEVQMMRIIGKARQKNTDAPAEKCVA